MQDKPLSVRRALLLAQKCYSECNCQPPVSALGKPRRYIEYVNMYAQLLCCIYYVLFLWSTWHLTLWAVFINYLARLAHTHKTHYLTHSHPNLSLFLWYKRTIVLCLTRAAIYLYEYGFTTLGNSCTELAKECEASVAEKALARGLMSGKTDALLHPYYIW